MKNLRSKEIQEVDSEWSRFYIWYHKEVFFWILEMIENEPTEKLLDWSEFVPQTSVYFQL